jgi:LAO/AO transport system kinase
MVDFFLLLLSPAAGDELQGIKRGVMELCDGVVVNKADGDLAAAAERAAEQCRFALRVLHADRAGAPAVTVASAVTGRGLDEVWQSIQTALAARTANGELQQRRADQADAWLESALRERLLDEFAADPRVRTALPDLRAEVRAGRLLAGAAARRLFALRAGPSPA